MARPFAWTSRTLRLCLAGVALIWVGSSELFAQQEATKEIYQDFRNKRSLDESLRLGGQDLDGETKAENEGLRITLPAAREHHWPVEIIANFPLEGDFEVTGTYEILSATRPTKGYGVGVHLNIADNDERKKFAKVCRAFDVNKGSVHLTEFWTRGPPKDYQVRPKENRPKETKAMAGQLRLVRIGPSLRYLVSDAPGQEFREVWYQKDFGAEDLHHFRFGVTDSGAPGNPVDARLIDLRIRLGGVAADKASAPAPLATPTPVADPTPPDGESGSKARPKGWLAAAIAIGFAVILLPAIALGAWFFLRRRSDAEPAAEMQAAISFACTACGNKLKVRPAMAGKKIKCSECGKATLVPAD